MLQHNSLPVMMGLQNPGMLWPHVRDYEELSFISLEAEKQDKARTGKTSNLLKRGSLCRKCRTRTASFTSPLVKDLLCPFASWWIETIICGYLPDGLSSLLSGYQWSLVL